ncbi:hypothetical protein LTR08_004350 [Meristemomyces frigidus]|nr:hypothetical protein LTR08_004350 [Meristemomyces frigidus]
MPALNYTPILAAIVTVLRALVVFRSWQQKQAAVREAVKGGSTVEDAEAEVRSVKDGVQALANRFMTLVQYDGIVSPMDRILHQKTYGMKIRFTTKAEGRVAWHDGDRITIDKISFTMGDICTVVHGLNEAVRQMLTQELMFLGQAGVDGAGRAAGTAAVLPALDLARVFDNAAEITEGWSFLEDVRNSFEVDGKRWMWKRMFHEEAMQKQFTKNRLDDAHEGHDIRWSERGVEEYMRKVRRFKEELLVLVHLTAGAPARSIELLNIQNCNGVEGKGQRGVFIDHGMVAFVTSYHKGYSASQRVKIIHRYVPREVGELVVYYLWLIGPFVCQLQAMERGQEEFGSFLWEPKPEETWEDDKDEGVAQDGGTEDGREGESEEVEEWSEDEEERQEKELIAQRSQQRASLNVDGFWDTDRARRALYQETESRIGVKISVSTWRQVYPAIQREFTRDKSVRETLDSIYEPQQQQRGSGAPGEGEEGGRVSAKQAGHGQRMEDMIYGLLLTESPFHTIAEKDAFRAVIVDWHQFLQFPSAWEGGGMMDPSTRRQIGMDRRQRNYDGGGR